MLESYSDSLSRKLPKEAPTGVGWRLASFFCCAGGFDLGFRSAGFELAFANDHDPDAAKAYALNLGHAPVLGDIRKVVPGSAGYPPQGVDVLTGGFPCVTFSMAGRRAGVVDDLNGKLYLELCRVIREVRPRYFVAENVRGMLSANGGNAVKLVLAAFLRLGYRTAYELVNMAEHGVPQTRERVVFVGVREDQWRGSFRFPPKTHKLRGDKGAAAWLRPAVSLREAIGDLPRPAAGELNGYGTQSAFRAACARRSGKVVRRSSEPAGTVDASQGRMAQRLVVGQMYGDSVTGDGKGGLKKKSTQYSHPLPKGAGFPGLPVVASVANVLVTGHVRNGAPPSAPHNMSRRVAKGGRPAPTLVSEAANVQPFVEQGLELRRMTVRECARVQSFPDWYEFRISQSAGYKLVGNAVPPLYARRLAESFLEYDAREVVRE